MPILYVMIAFCLSGGAFAEEIHGVDYPNIEPMNGFEIAKIIGIWNHQGEIEVSGKKEGYGCPNGSFMNYTNPSEEGLELTWSFGDPRKKMYSVKAHVHVPDSEVPGKLYLKFGHDKDADWLVLGTDYETYMVVCMYSELVPASFGITIWTRDQNVTDAVLAEAYKLIKKMGYNASELQKFLNNCLAKKST